MGDSWDEGDGGLRRLHLRLEPRITPSLKRQSASEATVAAHVNLKYGRIGVGALRGVSTILANVSLALQACVSTIRGPSGMPMGLYAAKSPARAADDSALRNQASTNCPWPA